MSKNKIIFYSISLVFIVINILFITFDIYYVSFLPVILIFILASIFSLDKVLLSIVFFTPLSIRLDYLIPDIPFNLYLPTEPLLLGALILFVFKLLLDGKIDRKILLHPVSIAMYINLFWIFLTSITSTMPGVSFKFLLSRLWFVIPMYFLLTHVFNDYKNTQKFIWLYIIPLVSVIFYTNIRLYSYGLDNQVGGAPARRS